MCTTTTNILIRISNGTVNVFGMPPGSGNNAGPSAGPPGLGGLPAGLGNPPANPPGPVVDNNQPARPVPPNVAQNIDELNAQLGEPEASARETQNVPTGNAQAGAADNVNP